MFGFIKSLLNYKDPRKQFLQIILLSFLLSFVVARFYSLFIGHAIYVRGYHIHHFYFGMLSLSLGGVLGILSQNKKLSQAASALIGIGIGLFADEIGLLLNCTSGNRPCVYYFPDTLDIIGSIALAIILLIVVTDIAERYSQRNKFKRGSEKKINQQ